MDRSWAPWAFAKGDPKKVNSCARVTGDPSLGPGGRGQEDLARGYTDNKSNESLLKKAMTTKYPSMLVLMETAEELSHRNCELQLQWIRRDLNQLADDLTNEEFKSFDQGLRIALKGSELRWRILDRLLVHSDSFYRELGVRKREAPARVPRFGRKVRRLNPY